MTIACCLILCLTVMLHQAASKTTKYTDERFKEQRGELSYLKRELEKKITYDTNNLHALFCDKIANLQAIYNLKTPFPEEFAQGPYEGR